MIVRCKTEGWLLLSSTQGRKRGESDILCRTVERSEPIKTGPTLDIKRQEGLAGGNDENFMLRVEKKKKSDKEKNLQREKLSPESGTGGKVESEDARRKKKPVGYVL